MFLDHVYVFWDGELCGVRSVCNGIVGVRAVYVYVCVFVVVAVKQSANQKVHKGVQKSYTTERR